MNEREQAKANLNRQLEREGGLQRAGMRKCVILKVASGDAEEKALLKHGWEVEESISPFSFEMRFIRLDNLKTLKSPEKYFYHKTEIFQTEERVHDLMYGPEVSFSYKLIHLIESNKGILTYAENIAFIT